MSAGAGAGAIHNTVVLFIELQGNRCGTSKSCHNRQGTGLAKFSGGAPLMTVWLTDNTEVAPVKGVPQAKVMSLWREGTGIAKLTGAAPLMTVQLTAIKGESHLKWCPQLNWCLRQWVYSIELILVWGVGREQEVTRSVEMEGSGWALVWFYGLLLGFNNDNGVLVTI